MTTATDIKLTPEQVDDYRRDGFLIVHDVFTDGEVVELDAEAKRLMARTELIDSDNIRCRWQNCVTTGKCRFDCFDPVIDIGPACQRDKHYAEYEVWLKDRYAEHGKTNVFFR